MKTALRLLAVAVVAGILGLLAGRWYARGPAPEDRSGPRSPHVAAAPAATVTPARPGDALPEIRLPGLDGNVLDLGAIAPGRPLLVNVWAGWCGPCVEEMPELQRFARTQGDHGVQVVGLALDTPEGVREFLRQVPVDYPILIEQPGPADASVRLGDSGGLLPYSVLVDAQRRVVKQKLGPFAHGEIEDWAAH